MAFASATPAVCTLADHADGSATVTLVGAGSCTIEATQGGNDTYAPATPVSHNVEVAKAGQTVGFTSTAPSGAMVGGTAYTVTAESSSGLPVNLTIEAGATAVCQLSGATSGSSVSFVGGGTCVINANQAGDDNYNPAPQVQQSFDVAATPTTTTVTVVDPAGQGNTSNGASTVYGQPVGVSVTVTAGAGSAYPPGTVEVEVDGHTCQIALADQGNGQSAGQCTLNVVSGFPGIGIDWPVSASYTPGSTAFAASSSGGADTGSLDVAAAATTSTLGVDPATPTAGVAATLEVQVAANSPSVAVPGGTVTFSVGSTAVCSGVPLDATGHATCSHTFASPGNYGLSAAYTPSDGRFSAGGDGLAATVSSAASTTSILSADPGASGYGTPVTVAVAVSGGSGTPGGTVRVQAGGPSGAACDITLDGSGEGSCALLPPAGSPTPLSATYQGDGVYGGSGDTYDVTVTPFSPTVTLSVAPEPSVVSDGVTLTAEVSDAGPGSRVPTGQVDFGLAGCAAQGLDGNGRATCVVSFATVGTYPPSPPTTAATATMTRPAAAPSTRSSPRPPPPPSPASAPTPPPMGTPSA